MSRKISDLQPVMQLKVKELLVLLRKNVVINRLDLEPLVTSTLRTAEEQAVLYQRGRSKCDGYIKKSAHQSGAACDFVFVSKRTGQAVWYNPIAYSILGRYARRLGLVSGHWWDWRDNFHTELA